MKIVKVILDIIMTICFVLLMKIGFLGITLHELIGIGIFFLVCIHKLLNYKWIRSVWQSFANGQATTKVKFIFTLDFIILLFVALEVISGILISQTILTDIRTDNTAFWSNMHHFAAYNCLLLLSVHIGLHWQMLMNFFKKLLGLRRANSMRTLLARITLVAIAFFGIRAITNPDIYCNFTAPFNTSADVYANQDAEITYLPRKSGEDDDTSEAVQLSSTGETDSDTPDLEEYLSKLICTGCGKCCPLTALACGRGTQYKDAAVSEYEEAYGESSTQDSEESVPSESTTAPASDDSGSTSPVDFMGLMGFVIAGTHYTAKLPGRKK